MEQLPRFLTTFFGQHDRLGLAFRVADVALLEQAAQGIPIVALPRARVGLPVADGQETSLSPHDHSSPAQNRRISPHRGDVFEGNCSSRNSRLPRGFGTLILG